MIIKPLNVYINYYSKSINLLSDGANSTINLRRLSRPDGQQKRSEGQQLGTDEQSVSHAGNLPVLRVLRQGFGTEADGESQAPRSQEGDDVLQSLPSDIIFVAVLRGEPRNYRRTRGIYRGEISFYSLLVFCQSLVSGWGGQYSIRCQPIDYTNNPTAIRMARGCWWYYFSKFVEFSDTIFFVLRKKNDHISTLHVIHHGVMPMSVWFGVKFTPGERNVAFWLSFSFPLFH